MRKVFFNKSIENESGSASIKLSALFVHIGLFALTFASCLMAGAQWQMRDYSEISNWSFGFTYAILIMLFLLAHEFGHYIASRLHKVEATLPYFIPFPIPELALFGTMGAVIKTKTPIPNRKALFDIGVSGPIAGFIVSLFCLIWGFVTLPDIGYLYSIHPEYLTNFHGLIPNYGLRFGDTLLFEFAKLFAPTNAFIPPMNEIYHYPFLCVGWFGLFVTSLNMLPMGQLDGGHIIYAMFGDRQKTISKVFWYFLLFIGFGSLLAFLYQYSLLPTNPAEDNIIQTIAITLAPALDWINSIAPWFYYGWSGWIAWALLAKFFIKLPHPYVPDDEPIDIKRKIIGWTAIIIFILSFSFNGIYFV